MSKAAKKKSHVPAKYIEDIAGLASSVEVPADRQLFLISPFPKELP